MLVKIEIDSSKVSLREYVVQTVAKEIVKIFEKEKNEYLRMEPIVGALRNASVSRLVKCWLKNVWPLPQLRLLRCQLSRRH